MKLQLDFKSIDCFFPLKFIFCFLKKNFLSELDRRVCELVKLNYEVFSAYLGCFKNEIYFVAGASEKENTHTKVWFQYIILKSHFCMSLPLQICCIFSEHLFLRTPLEGCLWKVAIGRLHWSPSEIYSYKFL